MADAGKKINTMFKAIFFFLMVSFLGATCYTGITEQTNWQIFFATLTVCEMVALVGEDIKDELKK